MAEGKEGKKWHRHTIVCPRCRKPIVIYSLAFTSGGAIRTEGICITCTLKIGWEGEIVEIMASCHKAERAEKAEGKEVTGSGEVAGEERQKKRETVN